MGTECSDWSLAMQQDLAHANPSERNPQETHMIPQVNPQQGAMKAAAKSAGKCPVSSTAGKPSSSSRAKFPEESQWFQKHESRMEFHRFIIKHE